MSATIQATVCIRGSEEKMGFGKPGVRYGLTLASGVSAVAMPTTSVLFAITMILISLE